MWSNPRERAAVDCGEPDREDVRKEIVGGNACGGMPGSCGSKAILLSHALGGGAITIASPPPPPTHTGQHLQLNNREAGPSDT